MNLEEMKIKYDAAKENCRVGHEHCTFGGMSYHDGYWIHDTECPLPHGDKCAFCEAEAETSFRGRDGGEMFHPDSYIWAVPACMKCAEQWVGFHPGVYKHNPPASDE